MNSYRTHTCDELRLSHVGQSVRLVGWVDTVRDHGGVIFIDLRDREGKTQVVFHPENHADLAKQAESLRVESVIQVTGNVVARLKTDEVDATNPDLATGEIEVNADGLVVLNRAAVLPFQLDRSVANEDIRLKYRFLDLRRPEMQRNMMLRHRITKSVRDYLDEQGFLELETPILSKSTPEGARDYLVPSRVSPGKFYALPQSPQQYKQLLMVAGLEKYFQIARCFRDEDLRADRQPEFTQVDVEASFITPEDIYHWMEEMLKRVFKESVGRDIVTPFPRMTWHDAMDQYGSDKPERRFEMKITDCSDIFANSEFRVFSGAIADGGVVKAINAKGFAPSVGQVDALTQTALEAGAKGLAFIKVRDVDNRDEWKSPVTKRLSDAELQALRERLNIESGDCIFFAAGEWEQSCTILGRVRLQCADFMEILKDNHDIDLFWVTPSPCSPGTRRKAATWPSTTPSPAPSRSMWTRSSRAKSPPTSVPRRTTSSSTATSSAAVPCVSMSATFRTPPSARWAWTRRPSTSASHTCSPRSPSARPPTAASPSAWTAWSCSSANANPSARSFPSPRTTAPSTSCARPPTPSTPSSSATSTSRSSSRRNSARNWKRKPLRKRKAIKIRIKIKNFAHLAFRQMGFFCTSPDFSQSTIMGGNGWTPWRTFQHAREKGTPQSL